MADQCCISRESSLNPSKAKARARDSKDNNITAEKSDIQPANAPGTQEDAKKPGAKHDSKKKVKESGKLTEAKCKEIMVGTSKQRTNRGRRRIQWIKLCTKFTPDIFAVDRFANKESKPISGSGGSQIISG